MNEEEALTVVKEEIVLQKFEGDPIPENLVEKVFILDGVIQKHEFIENGLVVKVVEPGGVSDFPN